ncbi:hypothetical protein MNBD_IGNAVI01-1959 [hydrothermal vent metagenome]|uniref:Uncharacterized protein n=1 Tax=hydrothermal vent metagenome TaxID=652676 RepID=A0A3B1CVJ4_9ZZZZ
MGFSSLIDILGSIVVGGMLLLILFRINDTAVANSFQYNGEAIAQKNLVEVVTLLEYDFRKIGYCKDWLAMPDPSKAIISADSTSITFLTDENSDGVVDTMSYYLGSVEELSHTANPRDRMLYRKVNHQIPLSANLGVTKFNLTYYDPFGKQIPFPILVPGEIHTLQIDIVLEDVAAYDQKYNKVFWRQIRLAARNLGNR